MLKAVENFMENILQLLSTCLNEEDIQIHFCCTFRNWSTTLSRFTRFSDIDAIPCIDDLRDRLYYSV